MSNTPKPASLPRAAYADMFGPTTGDRIRLADTSLEITVERDFTTYGEEVKFGGGKVIRDGMGQSQAPNAAGAVDTVITNAVVLDHWGIPVPRTTKVEGRPDQPVLFELLAHVCPHGDVCIVVCTTDEVHSVASTTEQNVDAVGRS